MKKCFKKFIVLIFTILLIPSIVSAKVLEFDDTSIDLKGEHDSTKLVFGSTINNQATIDGIGIFFGNQVTGNGNTLYGVYAGNIVNISDKVEKDLFVAGNMITILKSAEINRDLFIAGNMITIESDVLRDLNVASSTIDLSGITVYGDAHLYADTITFDDNTRIMGTLYVNEDSTLKNLSNNMYGNLVKEESTMTEETIQTKITDALLSVATNYICAVIILLMFMGFKNSLNKVKVDGKEVCLTSLIGLGSLIAVPIVAFIALMTGILLPLSLIVFALYIIAIYLSSIIASYIIGHTIWTSKKDANIFIELLIGLVIVKIVSYIPVIGGFISAIVLLFGFGTIIKLICGLIKK